VKQEQDHLDILVNNAWGGYEEEEGRHKSGSPFWEWSIGHWNKAFAAGVWSTMVTSYFAVPLILPQRGGLIANTTLAVGEYDGGWLFYHVPKKTINLITFEMATDLREQNIAVVGIAPGWTRTEAVMSGRPGHILPVGDDLKMTESPEYVGRAVVALATDPNVMDKTGRIGHTRDLGREYGFSDIDGRDPLFYEGCEGWSATRYK
jgi:NAD(P)-dependent dehydrogenase (short-subunit alcohol dehydrogenase family)